MKKLLLLTALCLSLLQVSAQERHWGCEWDETMLTIDSVRKNYPVVLCTKPDTPVSEAGLRRGDVVVAETETTLTVKRAGNQTIQIEAQKVPFAGSGEIIDEYNWAKLGENCEEEMLFMTQKTLGVDPIEVIVDPEANLMAYETFDFDFSGTNIIEQKEIAAEMDTILTNIGLRRDKENPQLVILIEYYSDRRDQYVPPTSRTVTRYRYGYEYGSGWGTRQYIESQTDGNYTKTEYLTRISLTMLDAAKIKQEKTDVQVWAARYEVLSSQKPDFKNVLKNLIPSMTYCFPIKNIGWVGVVNYWGIGVAYANNAKGLLSAVYPGGPAYKAGLRAGDKILNYKPGGTIPYDLQRAQQRLGQSFHKNHENFAFTRFSNRTYEYAGLSRPVETGYMSLKNDKVFEQNPWIELKVLKVDGTKQTVKVKVERNMVARYYLTK